MPVIFLMAFLIMGLALAVLAGTFVYVVCVGIGALSMFVRKHEPEIRCAACTYDILKKGVEKNPDNHPIFSFQETPDQRGAVIDSKG